MPRFAALEDSTARSTSEFPTKQVQATLLTPGVRRVCLTLPWSARLHILKVVCARLRTEGAFDLQASPSRCPPHSRQKHRHPSVFLETAFQIHLLTVFTSRKSRT